MYAQDINDESMFEAMAPAEYGLDEFVERVELITGADDTVQVRLHAANFCTCLPQTCLYKLVLTVVASALS
jgi:hypothetical protein